MLKTAYLKLRSFFHVLGPGVVTGAADDDPSGIATYSQTGAQFGLGQLWTALFMFPFQTAVQEACARIGLVTGQGIAAVVRLHYAKRVLYAAVLLILIANTINIGADLGAMAEATHLIIPVPTVLLTIGFTVTMLLLEIFTSYKTYARLLKWLALSLLAYPLTVLIVHQSLPELIRATFLPHIELNFNFLFVITGVLGTTISPYMFFWQASQETEESKARRLSSNQAMPVVTQRDLRNMRLDNIVGMLASEIGTWSIIVVTATVLHAHGITNIRTAADAARALEPLVASFPNAGFLSKVIFSSGIIGLGLLSIPVLAGSASYAFCEALNWKEGLSLKLKQGKGFYGVIILATLIGLTLNFLGIDPMRLLIYTAVINGVVAVPLIFLIFKIANNPEIMGTHKSGKLSNSLLVLTFLGMGTAAIAMFYTLIRGRV